MELTLSLEGISCDSGSLSGVASLLQSLGIRRLVPELSLGFWDRDVFLQSLSGVVVPAVRCKASSTKFTSANREDLREAVNAATTTARKAQELKAPVLILELGSLRSPVFEEYSTRAPEEISNGAKVLTAHDQQLVALLDQVCRALFEVSEAAPDTQLAIATPGGPWGWPNVTALEYLLDDLGSERLCYWHDTGRAKLLSNLGLDREEHWLDALAPACAGVDLTDCVGSSAGLPAGSGEVDFIALRGALGSRTQRCVRSDSSCGSGPLGAAVQYLRGLGY